MSELNAQGLSVDRFPDILESIEESEKININPNIYTRDDEVLGQINNIIAERISSLNDLAQAVYDSSNIDKAEGKNLDDLGALRSVSRLAASKSSTNRQQFVGSNGTTIPTNSVLTNPITGDLFVTTASIAIDSTSCKSVKLNASQVLNSTLYQVTVNTTDYSYTSDSGATALEIVTGLKAEIDADVTATWSATIDGNYLIIETDTTSDIKVVVITYIQAVEVTVEGPIEAVEEGEIVAPANSITQAVSTIVGLISTNNLETLSIGREEETDEDFRIRIKNQSSSTSTGTIPSIEAAILSNVSGVASVKVVENTTAVTDVDGRPPHSYETIVVGGDDEDIAQEIWRTKPAGIRLYGNTNVVIVDSNSNARSIDFTRPVVVNIAVKVDYSMYDEESFTVNLEQTIINAVVEYINALGVDEDVIPTRLMGPIYSSTTGVGDMLIEVQTIANPGDAPIPANWQSTKLSIGDSEFANTTAVDVYVTEV